MKTGKSPKPPIVASNTFHCCEKDFDGPEAIKSHLIEAHKLTEFKGRREMLTHLDCADSYHSEYKWTIGEVVFYQFTLNPRQKNDMMRFGKD